MFVCLFAHVCLTICLFACCLPASLCVCLSIKLFVCCLSVCLFVCLSVGLCVCLLVFVFLFSHVSYFQSVNTTS